MNEQKLEFIIEKLVNCLIDALEYQSTEDIIALTGLSEFRAKQIKQTVDHCLRSEKAGQVDTLKLFSLLKAYLE